MIVVKKEINLVLRHITISVRAKISCDDVGDLQTLRHDLSTLPLVFLVWCKFCDFYITNLKYLTRKIWVNFERLRNFFNHTLNLINSRVVPSIITHIKMRRISARCQLRLYFKGLVSTIMRLRVIMEEHWMYIWILLSVRLYRSKN